MLTQVVPTPSTPVTVSLTYRAATVPPLNSSSLVPRVVLAVRSTTSRQLMESVEVSMR